MVSTKLYQCPRCFKTFDKKSHYDVHMGRKRPCVQIDKPQQIISENVEKNDENMLKVDDPISKKDTKLVPPENVIIVQSELYDELQCIFCHKVFTRKDVKNKHMMESCPLRKKLSRKVEEAIKKILAENSSLREENRKLKGKKSNTTYNIMNAYINNTYNTVKLAAYGHEDMSFITPTHYSEIFNHGKNAVPIFIKFLHFNKKHPECNNIFISNIHDDYVLIFNGHKWMLHQRDKALDDVYFDSVSTLDDVYHKQIKNNPESVVLRFEEFLDKRDNDKIANDIKNELKLLFYNYKDIVENTKKQSITNGEPLVV